MITKANLESREFAVGTHTFPADSNRTYLMVVVATGVTATIEFNEGGGLVPITDYIEPLVAPISTFTVVSTGVFYVVSVPSTFVGVV